jgi:hypothetical protein
MICPVDQHDCGCSEQNAEDDVRGERPTQERRGDLRCPAAGRSDEKGGVTTSVGFKKPPGGQVQKPHEGNVDSVQTNTQGPEQDFLQRPFEEEAKRGALATKMYSRARVPGRSQVGTLFMAPLSSG